MLSKQFELYFIQKFNNEIWGEIRNIQHKLHIEKIKTNYDALKGILFYCSLLICSPLYYTNFQIYTKIERML